MEPGTLASGAQGSVTVTVTINSVASDPIANSAKIASTQTGQTTQNLYTKYGNCGPTPVPEFPGLILPVVGILGMVMLLSRKKEE